MATLYNRYFLALMLILAPGALLTKAIHIQNQTSHKLWGAIYYTKSSNGTRTFTPFLLTPRATQKISLPGLKPFKRRTLFVAYKQEALPEEFDTSRHALSPDTASVNVGIGQASKLSVVTIDGLLRVRPTEEHEAEKARNALRNMVAQESEHYGNVATVIKYEGTISPEENAYLTKRDEITTRAIRRYASTDLNVADVPRISLCCSGGGIRAMLCALGVISGLQKIGLLNGLTYMTGVSGGTWAITPWAYSQKNISEYCEKMTKSLGNSKAKMVEQSLANFATVRHHKALFGHGSGFADLYAVMLSEHLLKPFNKAYMGMKLSNLGNRLQPEKHPFPICTAVTPTFGIRPTYHWIEFTPYQVRLVTGNHTIPTWAFMRTFINGESKNYMPEPWLGYLMGIWGSAFSVSIDDVLGRGLPQLGKIIPSNFLKDITGKTWMQSKQFSAKIPNFTYGLSGPETPFNQKKFLEMIDTAHTNNLPLIPLLHAGRHQDLIIIMNSSREAKGGFGTMYGARRMLQRKYPKLNFNVDQALGQPLTYWPSPEPGTPGIIHISLHQAPELDKKYNPRHTAETITTNFTYSEEQALRLLKLTEHTVLKNNAVFKKAVKRAIEDKHARTGVLEWLYENISSWFM